MPVPKTAKVSLPTPTFITTRGWQVPTTRCGTTPTPPPWTQATDQAPGQEAGYPGGTEPGEPLRNETRGEIRVLGKGRKERLCPLGRVATALLTPFAVPEGQGPVIDAGTKQGRNFAGERAEAAAAGLAVQRWAHPDRYCSLFDMHHERAALRDVGARALMAGFLIVP